MEITGFMNLVLSCVVETCVFLASSSEPSPVVPLSSSLPLLLLPASLQGVGTTVSSEETDLDFFLGNFKRWVCLMFRAHTKDILVF